MPLNVRVSGEADVTPAIAPLRHDFSALNQAIAARGAYQRRQQEQAAAEKSAKAKQAADDALYNVGEVNDPEYQKELEKKGKEILEYSTKSTMENSVGSPEYTPTVNKLKNDAATIKGKSNALISTATQAYREIDSLPNYYNKQALNEQVYDRSHRKNDKGDIAWDQIDPKEVLGVPANPYSAVNSLDMYKNKVEKLPEQIRQKQYEFYNRNPNDNSIDGTMVKLEGTKATFVKPVYDNKQKLIRYEPGVTNEVVDEFLIKDPEIKGEAEHQYQKYLEAETIAKAQNGDTRDPRLIRLELERDFDKQDFMRNHVKGFLNMLNKSTPINEIKQVATYTKTSGDGGKDAEFKATKLTNQVRKTSGLDQKTGKDTIVDSDVPEEYRLSGKKLDSPLRVNLSSAYYEDTNNPLTKEELVGDKTVKVTRVFLQGFDTKTGKPIVGKAESLKKNPNVVYKWAAGGTMEGSEWVGEGDEAKEKKVSKNVIIPYDEISNDIDAAYGFNLDSRDKSEISDLELTSYIKQKFPKASPEEKVKIFKNIRAQ